MKVIWLNSVMTLVLCFPSGVTAATDARPGPLMRAALASLEADQKSSPPRSGKSPRDWSRVVQIRPGDEIVLTVRGSLPATDRLLRADEDGLTVLDTRDPSLPARVRRTLVEAAASRPRALAAAQSGEQHLPQRVRVSPAGLFFEEQRVADLADVIKTVPRQQVADVSVRRKHVGTHSLRGLLIGAGIGAAVGGAGAASCDPTGEKGYCNVPTMAGAGAVVGGVFGLEIGFVVGLVAPPSPDVIYHAD
jgi:hypothetical protein